MECEHHERLSLWLDGQLSPEEERNFSAHLTVCAACRKAREDFLDLRADLRLIGPRVDPFARRRALTNILAGDTRTPWWGRRVRVPVPVLAVIVIGFAISLGLTLKTTPVGTPVTPAAETHPGGSAPPAAGELNLSRYDRGGRAVMVLVPREARESR